MHSGSHQDSQKVMGVWVVWESVGQVAREPVEKVALETVERVARELVEKVVQEPDCTWSAQVPVQLWPVS
jgi:dihydroneopterin aldolase